MLISCRVFFPLVLGLLLARYRFLKGGIGFKGVFYKVQECAHVRPVGRYGLLCQSPLPAIFQETCYAGTHFINGPPVINYYSVLISINRYKNINTYRYIWVLGVHMAIKTSVSLNEETAKWIDQQIEKRRFASRSHAVEYAIYKLMGESEKSES